VIPMASPYARWFVGSVQGPAVRALNLPCRDLESARRFAEGYARGTFEA